MTLAQRIIIPSDDGRGLTAIALVAVTLIAAIALLLVIEIRPTPVVRQTPASASPIAKATEPACAAALARARDTRSLSAEDAIAASTAMLRACDVH